MKLYPLRMIYEIFGLNLLHGLMLLFGAESMYMEMAPGLSEEAMTLGATELEICSAFKFFLSYCSL